MGEDQSLVAISSRDEPAPALPTDVDALVEQLGIYISPRETTRKAYKNGLKLFLQHCVDFDLSPIAEPRRTLQHYRDFLAERPLSAATKTLYLLLARKVFKALHEEGVLQRDFSNAVPSFQIETRERVFLSHVDIERIFHYVNKQKDKRLTLLFTLLYYQGLRQREIVTARISDYNAAERTLAVLGKGRDERKPIHLHPITCDVLDWFLRHKSTRNQIATIPQGYLFYSRKNRSGHITLPHVGLMIRDVHRACGVTATPHAWRAAFVSALINSNQMSMAQVQRYTRHRDLSTLQRYYDNQDFLDTLPKYYASLQTGLVRTF